MDNKNKMKDRESGGLQFDPVVIVRDVLRPWLLIVLVAVMVFVGTYIIQDLRYEPVYCAQTTFVATNRSSYATVYNNLSSASSLAVVFEDLLNSNLLRDHILESIDQRAFHGTITAKAIPETNLLTVTVAASDPRTAFLVSQAIIDHHEKVTYQVVDDVLLEVLQQPVVPMGPSNAAVTLGTLTKMVLLAVAATVALLALRSYFRDTVRSSREARAKLDCEVLGEIPHEQKYKTLASRLRRRKTSILITNPVTGFAFTETIRKLRRRVERYMDDAKVLMVISLLENEGKSTIAMNLAMAMAKKNKKVLLIDCDMRKPACYKLLGMRQATNGLQDVLEGRITWEDAVVQDKKSGLYLLLERKGRKDSGDLLSSAQMKQLVEQAREQYDYVLLDLPPMAGVSDGEAALKYSDASLLVVRQNAAPAPALNKAIAALEQGHTRLLGCVLNDVYTSGLYSYGYGYGYGYGKYGRYGQYGQYGRYGTADEHE